MDTSGLQELNILGLLDRTLDQATQIVDGITPDQLELPTPCTEWNVRAILNHLVNGNYRFVAMAEGKSIPPTRGLPPTDLLGDDPAAAYRQSAETLKQAWRQPGRLDQMCTLSFGQLPARVALGVRIVDTVTHGWDLARATGQQPAFDPEIAQIALVFAERSFGEARTSGAPFTPPVAIPGTPFAPPVPISEDAPAIDRLAAMLGRQP